MCKKYSRMVLKTRDKFIEVARQLFARKGVENTTMNDIASASSKGRRTIYTYFKSKRDIFNAVIEQETDRVLGKLRVIVVSALPPDEKFTNFIYCRLETMREIVSRNGSLRAGFFRDFRKVDRARRLMEKKEIILLRQILIEGNEQGYFNIADPHQTAVLITQIIQGLDVPYIRDIIKGEGIGQEELKSRLSQILMKGIGSSHD